ncbi:hypothetical protein BHM03_00001077 [Ensete ventricosum]|uniref:Uncharacterized protein n=1 Tax=Ensete ventricosum TaxID=4639 RepID=A0A445M921_ENSVE|nr:hypothetical protein BHM03_00001077 [Ensete ventricosum]
MYASLSSYNQGLKFRAVLPGTGSTYRSISLSVCRPPASGGTAKNGPSTVDFGRRRPIEGESTVGGRLRGIGDRRKREEEEEKKQNLYRRRPQVAHAPLPPTGRPHPVAAHTAGDFFPTRGDETSPPARGKIEVTSTFQSRCEHYVWGRSSLDH